MNRLWFLGLSLILGFQFTVAQNKLSLQACLDMALENSALIKTANYDRQKSEYLIKEVLASGLPQINANGDLNDQLDIPTQILPGELAGMPGQDLEVKFGKQYNTTGKIQVNQLIFSQSYLTGLKAAKTSRELYDLLSESTREEIIYEVTRQYLEILANSEKLETLKANRKQLEELERTTQLMLDNGLAKSTDVKRIKVNRMNVITSEANLLAGIQFQKNYLKVYMGDYTRENYELKREGIHLDSLISAQKQSSFIADKRVELSLLSKQMELNKLDIQNIKAGYYPTLVGFGSIGYNNQTDDFDMFENGSRWYKQSVIGLQLTIPIFDGREKWAKLKQSRISLQQKAIERVNTEALLEADYRNARLQLKNAYENLQVQKENKELANEVYTDTELQYKEGLAGLTDLLEAETSLREARVNYNTQEFAYQQANLDLLKAQGDLNLLINKK